ncbi:MAG: hypothetical protein Q9176_003280 [Flavoplaca citrina]
MESSEMSWTPSSSVKKRKYNDYCDTTSLPGFPHVPGAYPQSPVSYADFGREMYLGSPTPETGAVYQGVSALPNAPMRVIPVVPESLRSFMQTVAGVATTAQTCSTYTLGLLAGPGGRLARYLQQNTAPIFEAIGDAAKRIKLTVTPESSNPTSTNEPPSTPLPRRISSNMNLPHSTSLPSQTSVLHNARETGLRRVRTTRRWIQDQQHLNEASHQMLEHQAADGSIAYGGSSSTRDPLTITASARYHTKAAAPDDSSDIAVMENPSDAGIIHDHENDVNIQIALHLAAAADSVQSSDLDGLDEEDLDGFESKEEKRKRMAQQHLEEIKALQAGASTAEGVVTDPDYFVEKLRMVGNTAVSPRSPKKGDMLLEDSVTPAKISNHNDSTLQPSEQHLSTDVNGSTQASGPCLQTVQKVPGALDEDTSSESTPSPSSQSVDAIAETSISDAFLTTDDNDTRTSRSSSIAPLDDVSSSLAVLGFSSRQSKKRSSDLEVIEQIKRENEAALAREEAERRRLEEAKQAKERVRLGIRRLPISSVIDPLTVDWEDRLADAMRNGISSSKGLATTSTGEVLRRRDFGHVLPQHGVDSAMGWLNDTIISAYLQAVVDYAQKSREVRRGDLPKVHAMNTFFYENLTTRGYESVQRWATRAKFGGKKILQMETIFVPINKGGNHWVLVHVNPQSKTIEYFDSFHHSPGAVFANIKMWLREELKDAFVDNEWTLLQKGGPRQRNASDCGVFATTTAKMIVLGVDPMAFSANDMPTQRRRMLAELMNGGLHGDFAPNVVF